MFPSAKTDGQKDPHSTAKPTPRPRPLFVNTDHAEAPVGTMIKTDPAGFALLLDGLALLAWNLAWLCRTQGMTTGTETWEDVCNIGKNLWHLLLAPPQPLALKRANSSQEVPGRKGSPRLANGSSELSTEPLLQLGSQSHSSTHAFLGLRNAMRPIQKWTFDTHKAIGDSLRKLILEQVNNADWEMLDKEEWDDGAEQFHDAVVVTTRAAAAERTIDDARSIMTALEHHPEVDRPIPSAEERNRTRGTSGWTKLKNREKE